MHLNIYVIMFIISLGDTYFKLKVLTEINELHDLDNEINHL